MIYWGAAITISIINLAILDYLTDILILKIEARAHCNLKEWYKNECPALAKTKRLAGETGQNKKKKKINNGGFRGHRKFNGDIVWRES